MKTSSSNLQASENIQNSNFKTDRRNTKVVLKMRLFIAGAE